MRTALTLVAVLAGLGACTPEIVPGAYLCGPNAGCPEDQYCNFADHTCGLASAVEAFACEPDVVTEPDDSPETGHQLPSLDCVALPFTITNCMPEGDTSDWLRLTAPSGCTAVQIDARVTFPVAFERLGLELVDLASGTVVASDGACAFQGENGDDLRCVKSPLTGGASYGIHMLPTGDGDCSGDCAFNRYKVAIQLTAPN